jgi:hypothetical protein
MRFTNLLGCLLVGGLLFQSSQKPGADDGKPKTPYQSEKERIEREIQGVWELVDYNNPEIRPIIRASGFIFIQDGWLSVNIVVTTEDAISGRYRYAFVGSSKKYEITDTNRLKLTDVWGFSNKGSDLTPDVSGTIEERLIVFSGASEPGQKLKIARNSDDAMTFIRRTALPKPTATIPNEK